MKRETPLWISENEIFSISFNPSQTIMITTHPYHSVLHDFERKTQQKLENVLDAVFISDTEWISVFWNEPQNGIATWKYDQTMVTLIKRGNVGDCDPHSLFFDRDRQQWIFNGFHGDPQQFFFCVEESLSRQNNMRYLFSSHGYDYISMEVGFQQCDIFETQLDTDHVTRVSQRNDILDSRLSPCQTMAMIIDCERGDRPHCRLTMFAFPSWNMMWTHDISFDHMKYTCFSPNSQFFCFWNQVYHCHTGHSFTYHHEPQSFRSHTPVFSKDSASIYCVNDEKGQVITRYRLFHDDLLCSLLWKLVMSQRVADYIRRKLF